MTDLTNPAYEQLTAALDGIDQLQNAHKDYLHEYRRSLERLRNEVKTLRAEIKSGQKRLFEPEVIAQTSVDERKPGANLKLLEDAITFCRAKGHASVKELCEHFDGLFTSGAVSLIDMMDAQGLLLPAEGSGPRKFKEQGA